MMGSSPIAGLLGSACSRLLRALPAATGALPFAQRIPAAGACLSSQAGIDASPAGAAERVRWTPGARASVAVAEEVKPDLVTQYLSESCMSKMQRNMSALRLARASVVRHASDCGSSEVQVSILTKRIAYMTEHLQAHPKDNHSRLGLMSMLANRKKLLRYLRRTDGDRYGFILTKLGLKDQVEK